MKMLCPSGEESNASTAMAIPDHYICPITLNIMIHPVMNQEGHNFERHAILDWLQEHGSCPLTRKPMRPSCFITNHSLALQIQNFVIRHGVDGVVDGGDDDFQDEQDKIAYATVQACLEGKPYHDLADYDRCWIPSSEEEQMFSHHNERMALQATTTTTTTTITTNGVHNHDGGRRRRQGGGEICHGIPSAHFADSATRIRRQSNNHQNNKSRHGTRKVRTRIMSYLRVSPGERQ